VVISVCFGKCKIFLCLRDVIAECEFSRLFSTARLRLLLVLPDPARELLGDVRNREKWGTAVKGVRSFTLTTSTNQER